MEKGLISIIVPVYNAEKTIEKSIKSLTNQTYKNIEIIVIDDGSTDGSWKLIEALMLDDNRIVGVHQDNKGVSAARNHGLSIAKGEYIGFCDSDDWADEDMYDVLFKNMVNNDADISIIQLYWETKDNTTMPYGNDNEVYVYNKEDALYELSRATLFMGHLWNKLFKASTIGGLLFDSSIAICEDALFVNNAFLNSARVVFCNACKYHYWNNPQSATNRAYNEKHWSAREAHRQIVSSLIERRMENAIPFASRSLIRANMSIARKMSYSQKLDKDHYKDIKNEIQKYREYAVKDFNFVQTMELLVLCLSRRLYNFGIMIVKNSRKNK